MRDVFYFHLFISILCQIGDVPNLEAARTDPSSDDMNQFILKRRAAVPETSGEEVFLCAILTLF
jgi:hypothetical protein